MLWPAFDWTDRLLRRRVLADLQLSIETQQLPEIHAAGLGQLFEGGEANVALPTRLDRLVMLVFQPCALGKRLLAEAARLPECPDPRQQALRRVVCHNRA